MSFDSDSADPPRECSVLPFWFWNDELTEAGLLDQIAAFERNGVYGFVIHPRVGLPRDCGFMSDKLLGFYKIAIEEAARRDMKVLLYDEGMYPSGSAAGQVVANHPDLACRCLALHDAASPLPSNARVVQTFKDAAGQERRIVDRPVDAYIRGLHYIDESADPATEDEPPAGDLLNPRTAAAVIERVYDRFYQAFGPHFGKTILGIFTDEPNALGRCREKDVFAGTTGSAEHFSRLLGYDITPRLPELWQTGEQADAFRDEYRHAVRLRLDETWYKPLSDWCQAHHVALCGHPDAGDEIGVQRYFQYPGQDLVWRWVLPDHPTALEGPESTQGKCSASAMVHHGRRRNSNEFAGAYGHEATFDEVKWLADWCLVRGVNLLIPHAFYYSVRGPRRDERPPQLGPHTPQWDDFGPNGFKAFADHCRRWSWLNTDSRPVVDVAILTHDDRCPWPAAKVLLTNQIDFHYLDPTTLLTRATVNAGGLKIADQHYTAVVVDGSGELSAAVRDRLGPLIAAGRVARYAGGGVGDDLQSTGTDAALLAFVRAHLPPALWAEPAAPDLRLRTVEKDGTRVILAVNESLRRPVRTSLCLPADAVYRYADPQPTDADGTRLELHLPPNGHTVIRLARV